MIFHCIADGIGKQAELVKYLVTVLGIPVGVGTLLLEYRWRRRHFAAGMIREWSDHTAKHRAAIEKAIPKIFDKDADVDRFNEKRAREIYNQTDPSDQSGDLKRHLIELLNYCEFVSVTYDMKVADKSVIQRSFSTAMCMLHRALHAYIKVMTERRNGNPWQPFCDLCESWEPGVHDKLTKQGMA